MLFAETTQQTNLTTNIYGGAAILQALNKNHHIAILGIKLNKPLLTL